LAEDRVADGQLLDVGADRADRAGAVEAEHQGEPVRPHPREPAGGGGHIHRVDRGHHEPDLDLAGSGLGYRQIDHLRLVAEVLNSNCSHRISPCHPTVNCGIT